MMLTLVKWELLFVGVDGMIITDQAVRETFNLYGSISQSCTKTQLVSLRKHLITYPTCLINYKLTIQPVR